MQSSKQYLYTVFKQLNNLICIIGILGNTQESDPDLFEPKFKEQALYPMLRCKQKQRINSNSSHLFNYLGPNQLFHMAMRNKQRVSQKKDFKTEDMKK